MLRKMLAWMTALAACAVGCGTANATANLLVNSDFSDYTLNAAHTGPGDPYNNSYAFGQYSPGGAGTNVLTGWVTDGYNFIMTPGSADTTGSSSSAGVVSLWGPGNGAPNGYTDAPSGHNYVAADGGLSCCTAPLSQTIDNLVIGRAYKVTFDWASAQQSGFFGPTTEGWIVSFGSSGMPGVDRTYTTSIDSNVSQGFTGWHTTSFSFLATGTTQTLSFLAVGTPEGAPPFSLLADPTLQGVPEPATWAMMLIGFGTMGAVMRGRPKRQPGGSRNFRPQAI
jgi:hypothetical protein